jgi:hypothetical protein
MAIKILIALVLTIILLGIPYLIIKNSEQTIVLDREKSEWFNKLKDHPVESIHLRVYSNTDSLLIDSLIVNRKAIERLTAKYLELPENLNPIPRLIWTKKIGLTFIQNGKDSLNSTIYITRNAALVFIPTPSIKNFEGLDDFYSSENLMKALAAFR